MKILDEYKVKQNLPIHTNQMYLTVFFNWLKDDAGAIDAIKQLNEKKYAKSIVGLTSKQISDWVKIGLIDEATKREWRKFSACEVAVISILKELHGIGFSSKKLKTIKDGLSEIINEKGEPVSFVSTALLFHEIKNNLPHYENRNIHLALDKNNNLVFGFEMDLDVLLGRGDKKTSVFTNININELCSSVLDFLPVYAMVKAEVSNTERRIIEILRNKRTQTLNISKKENVYMLEQTEEVDLKVDCGGDINNMLHGVDFGEITVKTHQGGIASVQRTRKIKLNK